MKDFDGVVDWSRCTAGKVPVVLQRYDGIVSGVAWFAKEELGMLRQLEAALARCRKNDARFLIDCDRDALVYSSDNKEVHEFWNEIPGIGWSHNVQSSYDVQMLLSPKVLWNNTYQGLLPAVVQDAKSNEVLMLAWLNREAWADSLLTGNTCFYSRSKKRLWRKGEESGNTQVIEGCQVFAGSNLPPTIVFRVEQLGGAACHEGYRSCFFRRIESDGSLTVIGDRVFDPGQVYKSGE